MKVVNAIVAPHDESWHAGLLSETNTLRLNAATVKRQRRTYNEQPPTRSGPQDQVRNAAVTEFLWSGFEPT